MSHDALPLSATTPDSFKSRHPWLSSFWEGGCIWVTRLGCVWVYQDEDTDLD